MHVDLTPLVQALAALALAAVTAAAPYFSVLLQRYLHVRLTATQAAAVQTAAEVGAKAAYGYIAENAASYRDVAIRDAAIAKGVQHVVASTPDALTALGITPEHLRNMVEARFGGLLAADTAVSIGTPAAS
ncbi:MAG TPA: hypothetical protein VH855_00045 [Acetobacteraceae bacterium]|jgi:hypothetical protein